MENQVIIDFTEEKSVDFSDALYRAKCGECKEGLEWEANFDADGSNYRAECCGFIYGISPPDIVRVFREKDE